MADTFRTFTVLDAKAATGTGDTVVWPTAKNWSFHLVVTGGTTGGITKVQGSQDATNWVDLITIATAGTHASPLGTSNVAAVLQNQHWPHIRGNVTTRTDGTYYVYATGGD
jgi:hypothetical protein